MAFSAPTDAQAARNLSTTVPRAPSRQCGVHIGVVSIDVHLNPCVPPEIAFGKAHSTEIPVPRRVEGMRGVPGLGVV